MKREQIEKWAKEASSTGDATELSGDAIEEFACIAQREFYKRAVDLIESLALLDETTPWETGWNSAIFCAIDVLRKRFEQRGRRKL